MEFCPYGDLLTLIERYRRFGYVNDRRLHNIFSNRCDRKYFPEHFLWETFFYLAEAALAMRFGPSERNDEWDYDKEIVHRDIKPPNSMLTFLHQLIARMHAHEGSLSRPREQAYWTALLS